MPWRSSIRLYLGGWWPLFTELPRRAILGNRGDKERAEA
jgi:hypothetical protein